MNEIKKGITFSSMGGSGTLNCRDCNYSEKIISFIHGLNFSRGGFQCQSCGNLTTRSSDDFKKHHETSLVCNCGGKLDRDKKLFCPKCKGTNLDYSLEYIT